MIDLGSISLGNSLMESSQLQKTRVKNLYIGEPSGFGRCFRKCTRYSNLKLTVCGGAEDMAETLDLFELPTDYLFD